MKQKVTEKLLAIKLRKQGETVNDIANQLSVAKSSVSTWVRNVPLSAKAEKMLLTKIKAGQLAGAKVHHDRALSVDKKHFETSYKQISQQSLDKDHQLLLCALVYWCEGAKDVNRVDFTNSDPNLVKLFLNFFRNSFILDERKFRICLHIHSYHNSNKQIIYWANITSIPSSQFTKPYQKQNTKVQIRDNYQGCVSIRYHDANVARQLLATAKAAFAIYN